MKKEIIWIVMLAVIVTVYFFVFESPKEDLIITEDLIIAPDTESTSWRTYRNEEYGFELSYPPDGPNGHMVVQTIDEPLDPNNIGFYERQDPVVEEYAGRTWYSFGFADAGCGGPIYETGVEDITFLVAFISCPPFEEGGGGDFDVEPYISGNQELIEEVLNSFSFFTEGGISEWQTYRNEEYGFEFKLPADWEGYSVLEQMWHGRASPDGYEGDRVLYEGPQIVILHPTLGNCENPENTCKQITIMIYTYQQWEDRPVVGAGGVGPAILGSNQRYVFALPPRWIGYDNNFGYGEEYEDEEAYEIVNTFRSE